MGFKVSGIRDSALRFGFRPGVSGVRVSGIITHGVYISSHSKNVIANRVYERRTPFMQT